MAPVARWFASLRPFSFPASVIPVALAAALAAGNAQADWWLLPLYLLSALLFHAGTNVLNDYYDFRHGIDGPDDPDPTHTLTRGIVTPRFMLISGNIYFGAGLLIGTFLALWRGPVFLAIGAAGAAGAYLYTGSRFSLKYRALGDLTVFSLMGPALVFLGVWTLTGDPGFTAVLISLPVAFLVTAILHGNNLRDRESDARAGVLTVAGLLGQRASMHLLLVLFLAAFITHGALVVSGVLGPLSLVAFASLPPALLVARRVYAAGSASQLIELPKWCAAVHLLHGVLYAGAIALTG